MWTDQDYCQRATDSWDRYNNQERWFPWGVDPVGMRVLAGLNMYRNVSQGRLMTLLGDAKIRQDYTLVMNFGLASGSGSEDQKMIDELNARRGNLALGSSSPAIPVAGSGSILNDQKWSPLVNDSFILGGTHSNKEFHLALQDFEQFDVERQKTRQVFGQTAPQYAAGKRRSPDYFQQKWKLYLITHPEVLWNSALRIPRVFARELVGLQAFGYVPDFNDGGIGFRKTGRGPEDFSTYLTALTGAGFLNANKARITSTISAFLFGNGGALE
jgi:hypothetical protein